MCGIIGYAGDKQVSKVLLEGLKRLEYRGYDSAGISILSNPGIYTVKSTGRISCLEEKIGKESIKGIAGIAHTRWATHGIPNEMNAHPHSDCTGKISIVHNGIIENYSALKKLLESEGHLIISDTDSEVLAHLIEKFSKGSESFEEAVAKSLNLVEGTFGIAVLKQGEEKIIAARKGSPLVLGIGENEMLVASDASAIVDHTSKAVYLNDFDMVSMTGKEYSIMNFKDGSEVFPEIIELKLKNEELEKQGFKHFMLKEIFEQPEALRNCLRGRLKDGKVKLSLDFNASEIKRVIFIGCGTSWHSGLIGKQLVERIAEIPAEVDYASEFRYRDAIISPSDLVVFISQSGETADTLAALHYAKSKGAKTIGIVNTVGSTISREVGSGIFLHAGPEIGVASTKAFTSQLTAITLLSLHLRQEKKMPLDDNFIKELELLPEKAGKVLESFPAILAIAKGLGNSANFIYLGRGFNYPVALEGALKLKEISYIHAEGYPAAEMKHGPIALVDHSMPVVFIAPNDSTFDKILSNMQEVKARNGVIVSFTNKLDDRLIGLSDFIFEIPETLLELSPILNSIPLQLLAYHIADLKGIDVDKPRNLAKSVTVE